ncbi:MAG: ABC transporter ATP-binding protein [Clostridia bacterium]
MQLKKTKYTELDYFKIPFTVAPFSSFFILLLGSITAFIPSFSVFITADLIDSATKILNDGAEKSIIMTPILLICALQSYYFFSYTIQSIFNFRLGRRLTLFFRTEVVKKRGSLAYKYIEDNDTWDLISRAAGNCESNITGGFNNCLSILNLSLSAASVMAVVCSFSPVSALILAMFLIPAFILAKKNGKREYDAWKDAEKIRRRSWVYEGIINGRESVEERTMFGYSKKIDEKWYELYEKARKLELKASFKSFLNNHGMNICAIIVCGISIGFMLYSFSNGAMSSGTAIGLGGAILSLAGIFSWNISSVFQSFVKTHEYLVDFTKFCNLDEEAGALDAPFDALTKAETVEFKNVTFAYPNTEIKILNNLSFKLDTSKTYAFVGINGAGKTTIIKLLTGLYKNYEGEIFINGKEIRDYTYSELKAFFSVVYQDFAKYEVSLKECIALGNVNKTDDDEIKTAISTIDLEGELSRFEKGLDTNLGKTREGGTDVSGGQWQRIALARSLVSPATIRVLDEPTSALDPIAESKIYEMFGRTKKHLMTILITHRLGAARISDEIFVLKDGAVIEKGSHEELLKLNGLYAEMFEAQRSWYL